MHWTVTVVLLLGVSRAAAQAPVRVRAETRIEMEAHQGPGSATTLSGALRDDLGKGLDGRLVRIVLRGQGDTHERTVETGPGGAFGANLPEARISRVEAAFDGDDLHGASRAARSVAAGLSPVRLHIAVPDRGRLDLDVPSHRLVVSATCDAGVDAIRITLLDETGTQLDSGLTDGSGKLQVTLPSRLLGDPGTGTLQAFADRDGRRRDAKVEVHVVRFRTTRLTLAAGPSSADSIDLRGRLSDSVGGLGGSAVGVFEGTRHLVTVLTDQEGRFTITLPLSGDLEDATLVARYEPDHPGHTRSHSPPLSLPARGTAWGWLLVPMLLCGMLVWSRLRRTEASLVQRAQIKPHEGIVAARRRWRSPPRFGIAGSVEDVGDGAPITGARAELRGPGELAIALRVSKAGRFQADKLPAGPFRLRVVAPGYAPQAIDLAIPHRGELDALTVRLCSLRAKAALAFRDVAMRTLPSPDRFATWTNQEIARAATATRTAPATMRALAGHVDIACYARTPPTMAGVREIEQRAHTVICAIEGSEQ